MTDRRGMTRARTLFTGGARLRCAYVLVASVLCGSGTMAQADAWSTFQSRCLDAFEAFSPVDLSDLQMVQGVALPGFSPEAEFFGPTVTGELVTLDLAPVLDGDRLCAVSGDTADRDAVADWVVAQFQNDRYEMRRDGAATILLSLDWIEPRLEVTLILEGPDAGTYSVLETYLES